MDKQNMVYIHTVEYYLAFKKEGNPITCYNMDSPWGHCIKWNKPVTKGKYCVILLICGGIYGGTLE